MVVSRAERRRQTLLALSSAALDLFEAHGTDVTIEAVAERAGVSPRTVHRHITCKEELAYIHPLLWLDVFDDAINQLDDSDRLGDRIRVGGLAVARHVDNNPGPPRRAFLVVASHPELTRGFTTVYQRWINAIAHQATATAGGQDDGFRSRVIGSATMGVLDATAQQWAQSEAQVTFESLFQAGFNHIEALLEHTNTESRTPTQHEPDGA